MVESVTVRAGALRKRIVIQTATETRDATNDVVTAWATFGSRWAKMRPLRGRELFEAQQLNASIDTEFSCRFLAGVTAGMRVLLGSRVFSIVSPPIDLDGRGRELILLTRENS